MINISYTLSFHIMKVGKYFKIFHKEHNTFSNKKKCIEETRKCRERENEDWRHFPLDYLLDLDLLKDGKKVSIVKNFEIDRRLYTIKE